MVKIPRVAPPFSPGTNISKSSNILAAKKIKLKISLRNGLTKYVYLCLKKPHNYLYINA